MRLTGQEIIAAAVWKAGGGAALARAAKMREFSDADSLGAQVMRWAKGGVKPPAEAVIASLDYLGVIDWAAVDGIRRESLAAAEGRVAEKSAQARERIAKQQNDRPRQARRGSRP